MIISISGDPGSGKSTIAKNLSENLGMKRYYMGGILREQAKKLGMTLAEYYALGETDETIDKNIDEYQKELGEVKDNFIIEGRTSFYFIPHSVKVYIAVDEHMGAERIWKQLQEKNSRNEASNLKTLKDLIQSIRKRRKSEEMRYQKYYNFDAFDMKNFDIIVDTTHKTKEEAFNEVLNKIEEYKKKGKENDLRKK